MNLGAAKPTEWVGDTIAHLINTRYNDHRIPIIRTNYANLGPGVTSQTIVQMIGSARALREESLGNRIGEGPHSRLSEMCVTVELKGATIVREPRARTFFGRFPRRPAALRACYPLKANTRKSHTRKPTFWARASRSLFAKAHYF